MEQEERLLKEYKKMSVVEMRSELQKFTAQLHLQAVKSSLLKFLPQSLHILEDPQYLYYILDFLGNDVKKCK